MPGKIVPAAPVPPFVTFVASAVPMVFDNSMSYYEALCALWKWLQDDVIDVINNNATVTNEYIDLTNEYTAKFIELKDYVDNYFDNLDVQEEINNKLDAMVEDGTLQELINNYLQPNVTWTFDTVADMAASTNLVNGSYARTLGYHSVNDGGAALYKVKNTGTADTGEVIALAGSLFAHLVYNDSVTVEQFGAYGDGTHDDQSAINLAMQSDATVINFTKGKTYAIRGYEDGQAEGGSTGLYETTGIVIPSHKIVDLNEATVQIITNTRQNYNAFTLSQVSDVVIQNGNIIGDVDTHTGATGEFGYGVAIKTSSDIVLRNLYCAKHWGDGINLHVHATATPLLQNNNVLIENCICEDNRRQGMSVITGNGITVRDCKFINTGKTAHTAPSAGVDVEPANSQVYDILFDHCEFKENYGAGLVCDGASQNIVGVKVLNCIFFDNRCNGTQTDCFMDDVTDAEVESCSFSRDQSTYKSLTFRPYNDFIFKGNHLLNYRIAVQPDYAGIRVKIHNNVFNINEAFANDGIITTTGSNSTNYTTLDIENNIFENISATRDLNIKAWVTSTSGSTGLQELIFKNNKVIGGTVGIQVYSHALIHNNEFIATTNTPINIMSGSLTGTVTDIQNNIFEQTTYVSQLAGVIWTKADYGYVVRNNTFYKKIFNTKYAVTTAYPPSRWLQTENATGVNIQEYNNIVDNT